MKVKKAPLLLAIVAMAVTLLVLLVYTNLVIDVKRVECGPYEDFWVMSDASGHDEGTYLSSYLHSWNHGALRAYPSFHGLGVPMIPLEVQSMEARQC
jgi:hypothetical protein